jgi:predicted dehydrogenase
VEDASAVSLTFESGAVATIFSSCVANQGYGAEIHLITRGLTARLGTGKLTVEESGVTTTYSAHISAYQRESELFLEAVETGNASAIRSPYPDSLRSLELTLAASASFERGEPIRIARS